MVLVTFCFALVWNTAQFILLGRYRGLDIGSFLLVGVPDGWCDTSIGEGFGEHCFGDYSSLATVVLEPNPWLTYPLTNYPAGALLPILVLAKLDEALGIINFGLVAFLFISLASICSPAIWLTKGKPATQKIVALTITAMSTPLIFTLDRGNSIALVVPLILWFLVALRNNDNKHLVLSVIFLTLAKPQFIILLILFLALKKFKYFAWSSIGIVLSQICSFMFWPSSFPQNFILAISSVTNYGNVWGFFDSANHNVSLTNGINLILSIFVNDYYMENWQASVVSVAILFSSCVVIIKYGKNLNFIELGTALLALSMLTVSISWSYYLIFAIPLTAVLLIDFHPDRQKILYGSHQFRLLLGFVSAITLNRVIFAGIPPMLHFPPSSTPIVTVGWLGVLVFALVLAFLRRRKPMIAN